jgi:hypothetical protein
MEIQYTMGVLAPIIRAQDKSFVACHSRANRDQITKAARSINKYIKFIDFIPPSPEKSKKMSAN